ncbi:MAG: ABC transporter, permease protein 1 (cluster 1, maltose/g3p/polyamine/iron), partial [uncultured Thermomicrobiales bacterium]
DFLARQYDNGNLGDRRGRDLAGCRFLHGVVRRRHPRYSRFLLRSGDAGRCESLDAVPDDHAAAHLGEHPDRRGLHRDHRARHVRAGAGHDGRRTEPIDRGRRAVHVRSGVWSQLLGLRDGCRCRPVDPDPDPLGGHASQHLPGDLRVL